MEESFKKWADHAGMLSGNYLCLSHWLQLHVCYARQHSNLIRATISISFLLLQGCHSGKRFSSMTRSSPRCVWHKQLHEVLSTRYYIDRVSICLAANQPDQWAPQSGMPKESMYNEIQCDVVHSISRM